MYIEILQRLGLNKNEAKIYESLLETGEANVSQIASAAKVNRRNVYDALDNLLAENLVIRVRGEREIRYRPADPMKLQHLLNIQKQRIGAILPGLAKTYERHPPEEQAFISRGIEGMKNYWKYVTSQSQPSLFIGGKGAWHDPLYEEDRKIFFSDCRRKGIIIQGIFDDEIRKSGTDIFKHYEPEKIRFFPAEFSTTASYDICGDRTLFFQMAQHRKIENALIFNIISQQLADSFRTWFSFLWHISQPLKK
ncbi:MAG: helix-turn-helix domain-containing protein [Patescibacteria group bacterium]|jgi:sugar-specific transcriptional regulator TrmB